MELCYQSYLAAVEQGTLYCYILGTLCRLLAVDAQLYVELY